MSFSPQSKVWIYQGDRPFTETEMTSIRAQLDDFTSQWKAHGHQLQAKAEILYNYFIVFIVDEATAGTTGCSIDASVRIIKGFEQEYGIDLFNRFNMAYKVDDKVVVVNKEDFETLISINKVNRDTIVFNNLVQTLADFETKWEVPFKDSWHNKVFADLL
ncbi:ABC transporter ATPase [Pedobacter sp. MC2016-15]|uniref:ABC transporter ATPase n=1 Tax=Pedobacter sp. MC2016-15 TaxID=2994473 RepID=UPI0022481F97|nr:ABC transporter ATPase [Pedobacter sp. MC2016-15]MCX2479061.1 ABC transporter ATPase [Pedobacter sp. MC2016-15]